jgi:serine/threonine-protein kinase
MTSGENPRGRGVPRPLSGGPIRFGPFLLEARLAVGGTAEVYIAQPIDPAAQPRKLVVKRLLPHFMTDPEGRTMFEREAALHAAVSHPNVVRVFGSGSAGDEPWLAMEFVDGCDLFRLLRRLSSGGRTLSPGVAVHITRELLLGLSSAHTAADPSTGLPMAIIHRDVTPSNVYLSTEGRVKLGDFGIARSATRATLASEGGAMLKGKFAYLAPEQVASEPFDQRADLFSTAVVLAEMLLGRPLFAGSGQLAVLLAIRDCRIDPLRETRASLPPGLFEVLERALARDPNARFPTAMDLSQALAPFDANPAASGAELAALVRWVQSAPSTDRMQAVREDMPRSRAGEPSSPSHPRAATAASPRARAPAAAPGPSPPDEPAPAPDKGPMPPPGLALPPPNFDDQRESERDTSEYAPIPSYVTTANGVRLGPWAFARLVEAVATGQVGRGDFVDFMGRGLAPLGSIEELARFLPAMSATTTNRLPGVGSPDFADDVSQSALMTILLNIYESNATGVLFAEGPTESRRFTRAGVEVGETGRKELYFVEGRLHHVASSNASELLGEFLVRRTKISRTELDFALAVLPRYGGRMGDTLVALGLVPSLEIFRAIRDQGSDRVVDLFQWHTGTLAFYRGQTAPHVEFPLDLALPPLLVAGLNALDPTGAALAQWSPRIEDAVQRQKTVKR